MKNLALIVGLALALGGCSSPETKEKPKAHPVDETSVPKAVLDAKVKAYPSAKTVSWTQQGDEYEIKFEMDGRKMAAEYKADGSVLETAEVITLDAAPDAVKKGIASSKYGAMQLLALKKAQKAGKDEAYKAMFKNTDGGGFKVTFDKAGAIAKEKPVSKDKLEKWQNEHKGA
ncbi:MAG TPA: PepSY-like domain-containing protein [Planctomycetota bacterium]|nr:PepSY-like domain-containing protein [Planctomycetota bacterium]